MRRREETRKVRIGTIEMGGSPRPLVQSMCSVKTSKKEDVLGQLLRCKALGADLMRLSVLDEEDARAFSFLSEESGLPLVADIHFDYRLALLALDSGASAVRINPGNIGGKDRAEMVVESARRHRAAIRIGANSGSIPKELEEKSPKVRAEALLSSIAPYVSLLESLDFHDIVLSLKGSDVRETVEAYRLAAEKYPYPLHLGITEAGPLETSLVRSAAGLAPLLLDGIGDTVRISLTEPPEEEITAASRLLHDLGLLPDYPTFISCPPCGRTEVDLLPLARKVRDYLEPTCGRTEVDLLPLARKVRDYLEERRIPLTVAVMGCAVNGPGEARHADLALCGGKGRWALYRKGEHVLSFPEEEAYGRLLEAIDAYLAG